MIDRNLLNVLVLGLSFMLLFTSFQTGGMIQVRLHFIDDHNANFLPFQSRAQLYRASKLTTLRTTPMASSPCASSTQYWPSATGLHLPLSIFSAPESR